MVRSVKGLAKPYISPHTTLYSFHFHKVVHPNLVSPLRSINNTLTGCEDIVVGAWTVIFYSLFIFIFIFEKSRVPESCAVF